MLETQKFARKSFEIEAVRVTEENMADVANWCHGTVMRTERGADQKNDTFIKVRVLRPMSDRQTQAHVGDWVLYAGTGFKVYSDRSFKKHFTKVSDGVVMHEVDRSAETGQFVSSGVAKEHPDTTVHESFTVAEVAEGSE